MQDFSPHLFAVLHQPELLRPLKQGGHLVAVLEVLHHVAGHVRLVFALAPQGLALAVGYQRLLDLLQLNLAAKPLNHFVARSSHVLRRVVEEVQRLKLQAV